MLQNLSVKLATVPCAYDDQGPAGSGDHDIQPPPILQETHLPSSVAAHSREDDDLLFLRRFEAQQKNHSRIVGGYGLTYAFSYNITGGCESMWGETLLHFSHYLKDAQQY